MDPKKYADDSLNVISEMVDLVDTDDVITLANQLIKSDVIVAFGNGGSYANATHMIGDILLRTKIGTLVKSIGDNTVMFSACGNDYTFDEAVAVELERYIQKPGVKTVLLFSTSGESKNIVRAAKVAKKYGCYIVAVFGEHLNRIEGLADLVFSVKGKKSSRIESAHAAICHVVVDTVRYIQGLED